MSDFQTLLSRTQAWFETAQREGWLSEAEAALLARVERATPGELFVDEAKRPLVVAFFGGTGVGKSSLLNRLAGAAIARTGVERPTSREVTVYVHAEVKLAELPPELPVTGVRVQRHQNAAQRDILWIDAPDIDSTEEANRRAALAWLPHVDLVCYVVSPERYRDDVGWRVLGERGHKHGWMFVLNHWDEGDARQIQDFGTLLQAAGFQEPLVLATCCAPGGRAARALPTPDQFGEIQATLDELLRAHGVRELTRLGHRARLQELRHALTTASRRFGDETVWTALRATCRATWERTAATIAEGAEWSLRATASRFAAGGWSVWRQITRGVAAARGAKVESDTAGAGDTDATALDRLTGQLWDDWTQGKLQAALDELEIAACRAELTPGPVRRDLDAVAEKAAATALGPVRDHVRAALARPGSVVSRVLRRATGFLMAFLPAVALMWVAWEVVRGYHTAAVSGGRFLGTDFAIHSALLVLIAWAVPFTADRLMRPSLEQTVLRALRGGLAVGLEELGEQLQQGLREVEAEVQAYREQSREILGAIDEILERPVAARVSGLARLVLEQEQSVGATRRN